MNQSVSNRHPRSRQQGKLYRFLKRPFYESFKMKFRHVCEYLDDRVDSNYSKPRVCTVLLHFDRPFCSK